MEAKEYIKEIALNGTPEQKKTLYSFNKDTSEDKILKKFKIFANVQLHRYFKFDPAPFHDDMIRRAIRSYRGKDVVELGFRGCAKTTMRKLFRVFVLLNDEDKSKKYLKVLSRDIKNSNQIVTDIYNMLLEMKPIYGDVFEKQGEKKTEETMSSFTMSNGVKLTAGTVGQKQRGHIQDAYRPDWIWFEDVEDSESVTSNVITQGIISKSKEAISGLAFGGSWEVTGNYISDTGVIQWFLGKESIEVAKIPIMENDVPTWQIYSLEDVEKLRRDPTTDFYGEYMCDPNRSDNKFFDILRVEADIRAAEKPIKESAGIKYWDTYKPHHRYGLGSDHSSGIGKDANTCTLFDFTTGEVVATYANNEISPDLSAHEFARLGSEFGNCIYAPEINNNCGGIVISTLKNIEYPNIYEKVTEDKYQATNTKKLGWETTSKSKVTALFDFKRDYNDGLIKIKDVELLKEMKAYTNTDLDERQTGLITRHFDLLMSAVIAWQMNKHAYSNYREDDIQEDETPIYPSIGM